MLELGSDVGTWFGLQRDISGHHCLSAVLFDRVGTAAWYLLLDRVLAG